MGEQMEENLFLSNTWDVILTLIDWIEKEVLLHTTHNQL